MYPDVIGITLGDLFSCLLGGDVNEAPREYLAAILKIKMLVCHLLEVFQKLMLPFKAEIASKMATEFAVAANLEHGRAHGCGVRVCPGKHSTNFVFAAYLLAVGAEGGRRVLGASAGSTASSW